MTLIFGGARKSYLVTIKDNDNNLTLAEASQRLKGTGLRLDKTYAPIPLDRGDFVVRATGTAKAAKKADARPGIDVFSDAVVFPATRP